MLGRFKGDAILKKSPWLKHHYEEAHERIERYAKRSGAWTILIDRYLPVIRAFTPFSMGIARVNFAKLLGMALFASALWVGGWFVLGWVFGNNWRALEDILKPLGFGVAGLYVIVIAGAIVWRNRRRIRRVYRRAIMHWRVMAP